MRAVSIALLCILMLTVIGLMVASVLLAFLTIVSPAVATLLTALCVTVLCLVVMLFLMSDRRRYGGVLSGAGAILPTVLNMIKRRPIGAVGTALAVGVIAELLQNGGKSGDSRRS